MSEIQNEEREFDISNIIFNEPKWIVRNGNYIFSLIFLIFFISLWLIKFPTIINAEAVIVSQNRPERITINRNANIREILVKDNQYLKKNTIIAFLDNAAYYKEVLLLDSLLNNTIDNNRNLNELSIQRILNLEFELGEINIPFLEAKRNFTTYFDFKENYKDIIRVAQERSIIENYKNNITNLLSIKEKERDAMALKVIDLKRFETLYNNRVISKKEWDEKNIQYIQFEKEMVNINIQIKQLELQIAENQRSNRQNNISEDYQLSNYKNQLIISIEALKRQIESWKYNYLIMNKIEGQISFLELFEPNAFFQAGKELCVVMPKSQLYNVKLVVQRFNIGKLKEGQRVNIKLADYPYYEYGMIYGIVKTISLTSNKENNLLITADLELPLQSDDIVLKQDMTGNAEIITQDTRLIERIFYKLIEKFSVS